MLKFRIALVLVARPICLTTRFSLVRRGIPFTDTRSAVLGRPVHRHASANKARQAGKRIVSLNAPLFRIVFREIAVVIASAMRFDPFRRHRRQEASKLSINVPAQPRCAHGRTFLNRHGPEIDRTYKQQMWRCIAQRHLSAAIIRRRGAHFSSGPEVRRPLAGGRGGESLFGHQRSSVVVLAILVWR
jgi:hypothetical protein